MKPEPFKEQNAMLGAGNNPNTSDMPVCLCGDPDGIPFRVSKWKLTKEELDRINETGELWLGTMGYQPPPPVMVSVFHPFEDLGWIPAQLPRIGTDG